MGESIEGSIEAMIAKAAIGEKRLREYAVKALFGKNSKPCALRASHTHTHAHTHTRARAHAHTHTHTHTHTRIHTHTCIHFLT